MITDGPSFQCLGTFLQLDGEPTEDSRPSPYKQSPSVWLLRAFLFSVMVVLVIGLIVPDSNLNPDLMEPARGNLVITGIDSRSVILIPMDGTTGHPDGDRMYSALLVEVQISNVGDEYVAVEGILLETTVNGPNNVSVVEIVCGREHLGPGESMVLITKHNPEGLTSKEPMPVVVRLSHQGQPLGDASGAVSYETPYYLRFVAGPDPTA